RSARTMEAYARDLEHFGRYLAGDLAARTAPRAEPAARVYPKLRDASASDIRKYVLFLMTVRRYKVVAVRRNLSALRTFYTFLRREGMRADQPALDVELPKAEQRKPKVLRLREVASIVKARVERPGGKSLAPRDRAIVELLYGSGIRRAELADLNLDDVDFGQRVAMVTGKGNKRRMVPLTEASVMAMQSYLHVRPASNDRAFFLSNRSARLGLRQVWKIVKDYAAQSGVDRATTHAMRHSFATHFIEGGGDVSSLQRLLGHANIATTQIYIDQSIAHLKKVFDAANPRDKAEFDDALRDA
ncbi:MAG TPA: tyrosine-type recombinase/integrase, partial [Candidatus Lustribacter sp.]